MKLEMRYWAGLVGDKMEKSELDLKPSEFRMAPFTQMKPLIADKDTPVEKGKPAIVEVQRISLPANTMVGCLNEARHALGTTISVIEYGRPSLIEEEKCISQALFIPFEDGVIKKCDLIGVIKVFFVRTGFVGKTLGLGQQSFEIVTEQRTGRLTWKENGNLIRKTQKMVDTLYKRVHIALLEPVIAEEDLNVRKNELLRVKIKCINLPSNTVVAPTGFMGNAYGSLIDVIQHGKPKRVEEDRRISHAVFLPVQDGKIERGDMLGALAIYFIELEDLKAIVRGEEKTFTTVYRSGRGVIRSSVKAHPYGFRRSPVARWELLISDENKRLKAGETCIISLKKLKLPKNTIVYPFGIMRHPYGVTLDTIQKRMSKVEEEKEIDKAVFLPIADGDVRRGELVGIVSIYDVEVKALDRLKSWLKEWIEHKEVTYPALQP
ncbi:MAG: DUF22 domain-containing protein [Archaeoglobaceae archaeon]|nr:DUF22 domain-containing protein [Archaeoglobaceae archaeon]MDW8117996.1 DUF22 domain-containing protein [Archaeoglobaceae archaeon]